MQKLLLHTPAEQQLLIDRLILLMGQAGIDALLLSGNATKYYLTGRVWDGYIYLTVEGELTCAVRRPIGLGGDGVHSIRKPEELANIIPTPPTTLGLELDTSSYSLVERLRAIFPEATVVNASQLLRSARSIKTPREVQQITLSGLKQERVYRLIPSLYRPGMTDVELQIEIERLSRLEGCLGQFRIAGDSMELFMGNIIAGDNADAPSPYDFAMGGAGTNPSLPVGADGTELRPGMSVMVDINGNYTGYMTDMTRTFTIGDIAPLAVKAHECSRRITREVAAHGIPGTKASDLYELALGIAREEGLEQYFMGHRQHAGFIGHGVGIEINELPVIAPRSRDLIAPGQVIALEPKFVIPGTGAVGIENTYYVAPDGQWVSLTNAPEVLIQL